MLVQGVIVGGGHHYHLTGKCRSRMAARSWIASNSPRSTATYPAVEVSGLPRLTILSPEFRISSKIGSTLRNGSNGVIRETKRDCYISSGFLTAPMRIHL